MIQYVNSKRNWSTKQNKTKGNERRENMARGRGGARIQKENERTCTETYEKVLKKKNRECGTKH